jgi:hypothetical protein
LAGGLGVLAGVVVQIVDRAVNDEFDPGKYFSFFTTQTALINTAVLVVGGVLAFKKPTDGTAMSMARISALAYAVVTFGVYNLLLRDDQPAGPGEFDPIRWPSELMHVWMPILLVLGWLIDPGATTSKWRSLWIVPIYPIAWSIYTFVRAAASGGTVYPYPFLDPRTDGPVSVVTYVVGLTAALVLLGALAMLYSRCVRDVRTVRPSVSPGGRSWRL